MMVPAIILAGGLGTRLRSVVSDVPKVLAPVAGKPFLEHVLRRLAAGGFDRVVLAVGYMRDQIIAAIGTEFLGLSVSYSIEEVPLGTGGAIRKALMALDAPRAFVINGDTWLEVDYRQMLAAHAAACTRVTLATARVNIVSRYGSVVTDGDGRAIRFTEKGEQQPGQINGGVYVVERTAFDGVDLPPAFSFESDFLMPQCASLHPLTFPDTGRFIDIGVPEDYALAQTLFREAKWP